MPVSGENGLTVADALQNRICLIYGSEKVYVVGYEEIVVFPDLSGVSFFRT